MLQTDSMATTGAAGVAEEHSARHSSAAPVDTVFNASGGTKKDTLYIYTPSDTAESAGTAADTLGVCPLRTAGETDSISRIDTALFYKKNLFADSALLHTETSAPRHGVPGDPIPYSIATDNLMTSLLVLFFIITIVVVAKIRRYLAGEIKLFFYHKKNRGNDSNPGSGELRGLWFLSIQTCLMYAILYFFYLRTYSNTFAIEQYQLIGLLFSVIAIFFLLKAIIMNIVNWTFFGSGNKRRFSDVNLFLTACEGLFIMPVVYFQSYFGMTLSDCSTYVFLVLILFRILAIFKQKQIFFTQKAGLSGFFIYLCTLEITPFFMVLSVLANLTGSLKIIF